MMWSRRARTLLLGLMCLNGLFFMANIVVLGDARAAIEMHEDLPPGASALTANLKVLVCFVTGLLYVLAAAGIHRRKAGLVQCAFWAFLLFDGFYVFELLSWGGSHPPVWVGVSTFGVASVVFCAFSWRHWTALRAPRAREVQGTS